jgi:hypothetical protein
MSLFDTKEKMVRTLNLWDSMTYGDAFANLVVTDENRESVELLKMCLDKQKLWNKPMNGNSSEGLKNTEIEKLGIAYVDLFNRLDPTDQFWTPLDFLHEMCKHNLSKRKFYEHKAKVNKMTFDQLTYRMCGRALRALPSFIREYQLSNALKVKFPRGKFSQDPDMDKRCHCDVKMELNGKVYYFWSFISSAKSIYNFVDKFKANRHGVIMDGNHVLCPFDRTREKDASYKGWAFYSSRYVNEIQTAMFQKAHLDYDDVKDGQLFSTKTFKRPVVVDKVSSTQSALAS